jgi:hypothetical protein
MKDAQGAQVLGRTKWRRFALVMVPAAVASGVVLAGIANGAIGASISMSGQEFKVSADELDGTGFTQYGTVGKQINNGGKPLAYSGISNATLTNLCQSVVTNLPVFGDVTLTLRSPKATATNLLIDLSQLDGSQAVFNHVDIGADASTVNDGPTNNPAGTGPTPGFFAQQAQSITVKDVRQTAYYTNAGVFTLHGMSMSVTMGNKPCF